MKRRLCTIHPRSRITDGHTIQTVRIKQSIIFRKLLHTNHILKTNLFKSFIPRFCSSFHIRMPLYGQQTINIEYQLLLRFHQFTPTVSSRIRGFNPPTFGIAYIPHFLSGPGKVTFQLRGQSKTRISQTGSHQLFRQDT